MTANSNNRPNTPHALSIEERLPPPDETAALLVRLVTDPLNPDEIKQAKASAAKTGESVISQTVWILYGHHPLAPPAKILRMYPSEDGGVEVYSSDGQTHVRTTIPERVIRFFDEVIPEETFVEFIEDAESEEEEEPDEPEEPEPDEPEPEPAQGQADPPTGPSGPSQES
jgi:hypothetical protein